MKTKNVKIISLTLSIIILIIVGCYKYNNEPKFKEFVDPIILKVNKKLDLNLSNSENKKEEAKELKDF